MVDAVLGEFQSKVVSAIQDPGIAVGKVQSYAIGKVEPSAVSLANGGATVIDQHPANAAIFGISHSAALAWRKVTLVTKIDTGSAPPL